jgi:tetratricopeptide (TPR) repeat protein
MPGSEVALSAALRAAHEILEDGIRVDALAAIAVTQSAAGLPGDAEQTFEQALHHARSLALSSARNEALLQVAGELRQSGRQASAVAALDQALQDALAIPYPETRRAALSRTAEIYVALGQRAQAAAALADAAKAAQAIASAEISDLPHRRKLRTGAAASAAGRIAQIAAARAGFVKALRMMRSHVATLNVAKAQAQAGLPGEAMITFRQAPESFRIDEAALSPRLDQHRRQTAAESSSWYDRWRAAALAAIAQAQGRSGLRQDASVHFNEAKLVARAITDPGPRAAALASVARSQLAVASPGDTMLMEDAVASLAGALADAQMSLPVDQGEAAGEAIRALAAIEPSLMKAAIGADALFDQALSTARSSRARDNHLRSVAVVLAASGRIGRAIRAVQEIGARVSASAHCCRS